MEGVGFQALGAIRTTVSITPWFVSVTKETLNYGSFTGRNGLIKAKCQGGRT